MGVRGIEQYRTEKERYVAQGLVREVEFPLHSLGGRSGNVTFGLKVFGGRVPANRLPLRWMTIVAGTVML